jgi:hypothetical protein
MSEDARRQRQTNVLRQVVPRICGVLIGVWPIPRTAALDESSSDADSAGFPPLEQWSGDSGFCFSSL